MSEQPTWPLTGEEATTAVLAEYRRFGEPPDYPEEYRIIADAQARKLVEWLEAQLLMSYCGPDMEPGVHWSISDVAWQQLRKDVGLP